MQPEDKENVKVKQLKHLRDAKFRVSVGITSPITILTAIAGQISRTLSYYWPILFTQICQCCHLFLYIVAAHSVPLFSRRVRIICVKIPLSVLFAVTLLRIIYGSAFEYFMVCLQTFVPLLHLTSAGWASATAPSTTNKGASLQGLGVIAYTNVC